MNPTPDPMPPIGGIVARGAGGIIATIGGTLVSMLPHIETGLRITSLIVGITVGVLSARSILKKGRK